MQSTQKYLRTSPRKLRLVASAVRGMKAVTALDYLKHMDVRAASPLYRAVKSALASVKARGDETKEFILKTIMVDGGPTIKRFRAVSRGSAHSIAKRTSHIKVILERTNGTKS